MQLRYYQQEAKKRVYDAFREGKRSVMLQCPTGCHDTNQLILMADGAVKKAKDIEAGDRVMGKDGTARNVLHTVSGEANMYKIIPIKGEPYVEYRD